MADGTQIEWTDATWNPITGCSVVSPGCTNCYAMKLAGTRLKHHPTRKGLTTESKAGPVWNGQVRFNEGMLLDPLRWRRPRMIFVCAHGDLFAENVPDEWVDQVFAVMALAPHHTFQVLTKRPERMRSYLLGFDCDGARRFTISNAAERIASGFRPWKGDGATDWDAAVARAITGPNWPLPNVWLGVSVEDQKRADERIPVLLETPAAIRWVSAEPLLSDIDIRRHIEIGHLDSELGLSNPGIDWVVAGGESGPGARPMHPDWARSLRDQCASADVAFLFKQWGEYLPCPWKVERLHDETDEAYKARSEAECSRLAVSRQGFVHEMSHAPWSQERVLPQPETHHAIRKVGKRVAGRLLDGVEHNAFPTSPQREEA